MCIEERGRGFEPFSPSCNEAKFKTLVNQTISISLLYLRIYSLHILIKHLNTNFAILKTRNCSP